jgi:hypothetical protein
MCDGWCAGLPWEIASILVQGFKAPWGEPELRALTTATVTTVSKWKEYAASRVQEHRRVSSALTTKLPCLGPVLLQPDTALW